LISFSKLGNYGRLGNQLFQYAYLRGMAQRLNTTFHCPQWDGDRIFDLGDEALRAPSATGITSSFNPHPEVGYTDKALAISDGTEVEGFFQSECYYESRDEVLRWYTFKEEIAASVRARYPLEVCKGAATLSLMPTTRTLASTFRSTPPRSIAMRSKESAM